MHKANASHHGFSLIELIIVILIIALLIGILLLVVARVRESGRSTVCLANLQQWGAIYQTYMSANHGKSLPEWEYPVWRTPWQMLDAYGKSSAANLRCPSAMEPKSLTLPPADQGGQSGIRGSAKQAWIWKNQVGEAIGSYGFNVALFDISRRHEPPSQPLYFHFPVKDAARIPAFADCIFPAITPVDQPPSNLEMPDGGSGICDSCINRHQMAVNVAFLDGHAEHVPLTALYQLAWREGYTPHVVKLPGS